MLVLCTRIECECHVMSLYMCVHAGARQPTFCWRGAECIDIAKLPYAGCQQLYKVALAALAGAIASSRHPDPFIDTGVNVSIVFNAKEHVLQVAGGLPHPEPYLEHKCFALTCCCRDWN